MLAHQQLPQSGVVGALVAAFNSFGLLDWAGSLAAKVVVALVLAAISGFGYQLGRWLWLKVSREPDEREGP